VAKKHNTNIKRLQSRIEDLEYECAQVREDFRNLLAHIDGMLAQTNKEIADLQFQDELQFAASVTQLIAIKKTLSVLSLVGQQIWANRVKEGQNGIS
jgi:ABC-type transporter Mla subunit MlaD